MDGHRLTKLVKDDAKMKRIPIIIFSSLINDEMQIKGKKLGESSARRMLCFLSSRSPSLSISSTWMPVSGAISAA